MRPSDILLALATMVIWGLNFSVTRTTLGVFPPLLAAALRFALVGLVVVPFCARPTRLLPIAGLAAIFGFLHYAMLFFGLSRIDASTASIVMQLQVPFGAVLAALILGEKLPWRDTVGVATALTGVLLIAGAPRLESNRVGLVFLVVAAFGWGLGTVQLKRLGPIDPFTLNGWLAIFLAPALFLVSQGLEGPALPVIEAAGWRGWGGILYMSLISTIIAFGLWARTVSRYSVGQAMPFLLTLPLIATVSGNLLNGERLTFDIAAGGALTIAGVAAIVLRRPDAAAAAAAPTTNPA